MYNSPVSEKSKILLAFQPFLKNKEKAHEVTSFAIPCCSSTVTSLLFHRSHVHPSGNVRTNAQKLEIQIYHDSCDRAAREVA